MPTSKTYLPDVNVWLALSSRRHIHNTSAANWVQNLGQEGVAFCRVTQMGLLRLLTNPKAMGVDVVSQAQAWNVYGQIHEDSRVTFLVEPAGLEAAWRSFTQQDKPVPNAWTDAYLLAFARARDLTFVTFDQAFQTVTDSSVIILS